MVESLLYCFEVGKTGRKQTEMKSKSGDAAKSKETDVFVGKYKNTKYVRDRSKKPEKAGAFTGAT